MSRRKKTDLADITAADTEANEAVLTSCPTLVDVPFAPGFGLSNGHVQTLYASSVRPSPALRYRRQCVRCPDGGFLALDWAVAVDTLAQDAPTLMILPGAVAAGSAHVSVCCYAAAAVERGFQPVVVNSRGCAKSPVTNDRLCEVSTTDDIRVAIQTIYESRPLTRVMAAGFGFGANSLMTYLGEEGARAHIDAAVSMSNPFDVKACMYNLSKSWTRLYDRSLAGSFVELLRPHTALFEGLHRDYDVQRALHATSMREFDEAITIRSLGFASADDYYDSASCAPLLPKVAVPTLCLQARDDPICPLTAVPLAVLQRNRHITMVVTEAGGHAGWLAGSVAAPESWAEPATLEWLQAMASLGRERKYPPSMPIAAARTVALNRAREAAAATAAAYTERLAAAASMGVPSSSVQEAPEQTGGDAPTIGEMLEARERADGGADPATVSVAPTWRGRYREAAPKDEDASFSPLDGSEAQELAGEGTPPASEGLAGGSTALASWLRSTGGGASSSNRWEASDGGSSGADSTSSPHTSASEGPGRVNQRRLTRQPARIRGADGGSRGGSGVFAEARPKQAVAAWSSVLASITAQRREVAAAIEGTLGPVGARLRTAPLPLRLGTFLLAVALLASPGFLALWAGSASRAALPLMQRLETASAIGLYVAIHATVWWWGRLVCGYRAPFQAYGLLCPSLGPSGFLDGALAMVCGLLLVAALYGIPLAAGWPTLAPRLPELEVFATATGMSLGVAWVEELLFRGWLMHESAHLGRHASALFSAVIFAAAHGSLAAAPGLALLGLALTGLARAAGTLALPIGLHAGVVAGYYVAIPGGLVTSMGNAPVWLVGSMAKGPLSGLLGVTMAACLAIPVYFAPSEKASRKNAKSPPSGATAPDTTPTTVASSEQQVSAKAVGGILAQILAFVQGPWGGQFGDPAAIQRDVDWGRLMSGLAGGVPDASKKSRKQHAGARRYSRRRGPLLTTRILPEVVERVGAARERAARTDWADLVATCCQVAAVGILLVVFALPRLRGGSQQLASVPGAVYVAGASTAGSLSGIQGFGDGGKIAATSLSLFWQKAEEVFSRQRSAGAALLAAAQRNTAGREAALAGTNGAEGAAPVAVSDPAPVQGLLPGRASRSGESLRSAAACATSAQGTAQAAGAGAAAEVQPMVAGKPAEPQAVASDKGRATQAAPTGEQKAASGGAASFTPDMALESEEDRIALGLEAALLASPTNEAEAWLPPAERQHAIMSQKMSWDLPRTYVIEKFR